MCTHNHTGAITITTNSSYWVYPKWWNVGVYYCAECGTDICNYCSRYCSKCYNYLCASCYAHHHHCHHHHNHWPVYPPPPKQYPLGEIIYHDKTG